MVKRTPITTTATHQKIPFNVCKKMHEYYLTYVIARKLYFSVPRNCNYRGSTSTVRGKGKLKLYKYSDMFRIREKRWLDFRIKIYDNDFSCVQLVNRCVYVISLVYLVLPFLICHTIAETHSRKMYSTVEGYPNIRHERMEECIQVFS